MKAKTEAKTAFPVATIDFNVGSGPVKADTLTLISRARGSLYDPLVAQIQAVKPGEALEIRPKSADVVKDRPQHIKFRNRMQSVAARAMANHPKNFKIRVLMTSSGVAFEAVNPNA